MATINYTEELDLLETKGIDVTTPPMLIAPGFSYKAENVNLGLTGGYVKRNGYVNQFTLENQLNGFSIRQGLEYRKKILDSTSDVVETLLYATNNEIGEAANGKLGKIEGGIFNPFVDKNNSVLNISASIRPSFSQINNSLFVFNGVNSPFVYEENGVYTRPLGLKYPVSEVGGETPHKTEAEIYFTGFELQIEDGYFDDENWLNNGDYLYCYTYALRSKIDNQLVAESSPADISDPITPVRGSRNGRVVFKAFPDWGQAYLDHLNPIIRVWRTVVNGNILFLEKEIPAGPGNEDGEIEYISSVPDTRLESEQMPFDNSRISDYTGFQKPRFPLIFRNRLVVFHEKMNRGRYSKITRNGPMPESFPVQNEFSVEGRFGAADALVGAGQIRGIPIILKERSVGRLEEIGLPDFGNSDDLVMYTYREISETVGAVSQHAQCQVFDELVFLGRDNVYATDGQNLRPIGNTIQALIKNADFSQSKAEKISMINDTKNRRIYIQLCKTLTDTEPNLTLVGDYQLYPTFRWTTYEKNATINSYGLDAGCFFQTEATADGGLDIYFGSATEEGQYYKMNTGLLDCKTQINGADTVFFPPCAEVISRPYFLGSPLQQKLFKTARVYAISERGLIELNVGMLVNLGTEPEKAKTLFKGAGNWDEKNWAPPIDLNTLFWAGYTLEEFKYQLHKKARGIQLKFTHQIEEPLTLIGWGVSGSLLKPR